MWIPNSCKWKAYDKCNTFILTKAQVDSCEDIQDKETYHLAYHFNVRMYSIIEQEHYNCIINLDQMSNLDQKIIETGDLPVPGNSKDESPGTLYWIFMFSMLGLPFIYLTFFR